MYRKLYFTNLSNPKNPNLNLDSTDYGCKICLVMHSFGYSAMVLSSSHPGKMSLKMQTTVSRGK